jgi:putative ABC transport system substrate-binding protein
MRRRAFVGGVLGLLAGPPTAQAQSASKVHRIGWLGAVPPTTPEISRSWEAFLHGLRELGYVEGKNILIERRFHEGHFTRLPQLAAELVALNVDLIVATTAPETRAAKQATTTIPIVMVSAGEAVELGLVASLAQPGGNVTGLTQMLPELVSKRLELLKEVIPTASRVAVLWNAANPTKIPDWRELQIVAPRLGVTLSSIEVRGPEDFTRAFAAMSGAKFDALMTLDDTLTVARRTQIVDFAAKRRLPVMYGARQFVPIGGFMAYGADNADLARRAALYVHKILTGTKPADLPVEQPTKFELVINLRTAKALGVTIPPAVLARADEVIQ